MLMDTVIGTMLRHFKSLNATNLWESAVNDNVTAQMYDLNQDQLDDGLFSDGTDTPEYAPVTRIIKQRQGKKSEFMNFHDTGYTRSTIDFEPNKDGVMVDMVDRYDLLGGYSENIIGLTDESKDYLRDEIIENIQEKIAGY